MAVSPFSSVLLGNLLSDTEIAPLFDDRAQLRRMLRFEAALARVEGRLGLIPPDAAQAIAEATERFVPDPAGLAEHTAKDGIPVPALLAALREQLPSNASGFLHWGATSQDVIDTAFVLAARDALAIIERRLVALARSLGGLADRHRRTVMPGRTRHQAAVPISFGTKVVGWLAPLLRDLDRLREVRPRLFVLAFAGAAGNLSALGDRGVEVEKALAEELRLGLSTAPWHSTRDSVAELGSWLALVTGTLAKIGQDLILLAQTEVAEIRLDGGGSSTMPQKSNPVGPELLLALGRFNAERIGSLFGAMIHAHERDGAAWMTEWLTLPEMITATGGALRIAEETIGALAVDEARMRAHVESPPALLFAEAATFALAVHMPRNEAEALVKKAVRDAMLSGEHLLDVVARLSPAAVDWQALREPEKHLGNSEAVIDRVLAKLSAIDPSR